MSLKDTFPKLIKFRKFIKFQYFYNYLFIIMKLDHRANPSSWILTQCLIKAFVVSSVSRLFWLFSPQKSLLHLTYSRHLSYSPKKSPLHLTYSGQLSFLLFQDSFGTMPPSQLSKLSVCVRFSLICGTGMSDYRIGTIYNVSCLHV